MADPSGRFVVRVPPSLHARLRRESSRLGVSLNDLCRTALESCVAEEVPRYHPEGAGRSTLVETASAIVGDELLGVVLFGSAARGEALDSSDTDILIVATPAVAVTRDLYRRWDELCANRTVSPHFVHLPDGAGSAGSIWYEVALDGIVLHETDRVLTRALQGLRRAIADGSVERRYSHGHPYWVRNTEAARAQ